jgi:acyl-CoA thioesterase
MTQKPKEGAAMDQCREFFKKDAFAGHCGVELIEAGDGRASARLVIRPEHLNSVGIVHGAAIFTLADTVFAAASNSHDHVAVAININISYLKAAKEGILTARAEEINRDGKIGSYTITVTNQQEETVAIFQGMVYRKIK